jgi:hypothetical protein
MATCGMCGGSKRCKACGGKGKYSTGETCPVCNGSKRCPLCHGTGKA